MQPIRVLRIVARMNVGGPAVEITGLMRGLDPAAFDQRLVTGWCAPDEADFLLTQAPDVPVTRIDGLGRAVRPWDDVRTMARVMAQVRDFEPDVIHTHTAKAGVVGRVAARLTRGRVKVVHTHHGHLLHGYFGPRRTRAVVELERALSRSTDRLVTVGQRVRDDLLAAGIGRPDQYVVIRSGVELGPLPDRGTARRELGLPAEAGVVVVMGRLTRIKRPDRLAAVAEILHRSHPLAMLVVAGSGDQEPALARRVRERNLPVTMLGWRTDIERILAAADVLLLTSDNEGTPLSAIQAGLAGVPVVSTRVGSVPEVVLHERTGILTSADPRELAAAVGRLLDDSTLAAGMGDAGRHHAEARFSVPGFLAAHAAVYADLVADGSARSPHPAR
jgi:glycosyltransferase involved in cell wall biosynthesis